MNANGQLLKSLLNSTLFRDYARAYTEATGMPVTLRPVETWHLPLHGRDKENSFCALMAEKSRTCAACLQLQGKLSQLAMDAPATITCAYGLCETAVPVKLGTQTVGFLQTGQVLREKPTNAKFARAAATATKLGAQWDRARARTAFFQTPVIPARKLQSVSYLLSTFAENLSFKSNQIVVQQANAEPPIVSRAKEFIREHITDDLTLGQVAAAVHTSIFYFCKLFRRVTGMTFTEFVSRTRIEKAKNLLLNPNLRISEIAYASGFQSLTHFNRVFKSVVGESPTEYRGHLPKPAACHSKLWVGARASKPAAARVGVAARRFVRAPTIPTAADPPVRAVRDLLSEVGELSPTTSRCTEARGPCAVVIASANQLKHHAPHGA